MFHRHVHVQTTEQKIKILTRSERVPSGGNKRMVTTCKINIWKCYTIDSGVGHGASVEQVSNNHKVLRSVTSTELEDWFSCAEKQITHPSSSPEGKHLLTYVNNRKSNRCLFN